METAVSTCNLCSFETKSKPALKRHYSIVTTKKLTKTRVKVFQCQNCVKEFKNKASLSSHFDKSHIQSVRHVETEDIGNLKQRILELEQIVNSLKSKEMNIKKPEVIPVSGHNPTKEPQKPNSKDVLNQNDIENILDQKMEIDEEIPIPAHLLAVKPEHLPLLRGFRMFARAKGNGACGTHCGSMHMLEDDSDTSMMKMKSKMNNNIADNMDHYIDMIGFPYSETVLGEPENQVCTTKEELVNIFRSDRALNVYSNIQELQAMSNIFNMPIEVFSFGTRTGVDGKEYQLAQWIDPILPEPKAAHMAEYREGYYPAMHLYYSSENHFDLLVPDSSRIITCGLLGKSPTAQVQQEGSAPPPFQESAQWHHVSVNTNQQKKVQPSSGSYKCEKCNVELESKGLLDAHIFNHDEPTNNSEIICDDCEEVCSLEEVLIRHMKYEHDDGTWTCNDCQFQTNKSELLMKHLKKKGHQPSDSSRKQNNDIRTCYTCKNKFEGYIALMDHRKQVHPSDQICKKIPRCERGETCWYVHPGVTPSVQNDTTLASSTPQQEKIIKCRDCGKIASSRNQFMAHRKAEHTSRIVCKHWLTSNCRREEKDCWYRHSHLPITPSVQSVPTQKDFPNALPPHQPPAQLQQPVLLAPQIQAQNQVWGQPAQAKAQSQLAMQNM